MNHFLIIIALKSLISFTLEPQYISERWIFWEQKPCLILDQFLWIWQNPTCHRYLNFLVGKRTAPLDIPVLWKLQLTRLAASRVLEVGCMVTLPLQAEVEFRTPVGTRWGTQNEKYFCCPSPVMLANGSTLDISNTCQQRAKVLKTVGITSVGVTPRAAPLHFFSFCGLPFHFLRGIPGNKCFWF